MLIQTRIKGNIHCQNKKFSNAKNKNVRDSNIYTRNDIAKMYHNVEIDTVIKASNFNQSESVLHNPITLHLQIL